MSESTQENKKFREVVRAETYGLMNCMNEEDFDVKWTCFEEKYANIQPAFLAYFVQFWILKKQLFGQSLEKGNL